MHTTNLTCDRCQDTETVSELSLSKLKLKRVGVVCENGQYDVYNGVPMASIKACQEWCEDCRKKLHLEFVNEEEKKAMPKPSLEEQLIELMRKFVQENAPSE